jgi:hypothetical protein
MPLFTVSQVATFGAEQEWKPQNRNVYKRFIKRFSLPRPLSAEEKFNLSKALAFAYEYLAEATQEERERLAAMPDQIDAWQQMKGRAGVHVAEEHIGMVQMPATKGEPVARAIRQEPR